MKLPRRNFLVLGAGAALSGILASCTRKTTPVQKQSLELLPVNADGVRTLPGFTARIVATTGKAPARSSYLWHRAPDGGAVFTNPAGGYIYVSNSEINYEQGGAGALSFDASGHVQDAYSILRNTSNNCAGGATPWNTWLSCEEHPQGLVWECDPFGKRIAEARPALGVFQHEAAAADATRHAIYLTEDQPDGLLYRFTPAAWQRLKKGTLEALVSDGANLSWETIPDPSAKSQPTRYQLKNAVHFQGGEGAWVEGEQLYFTTKIDNRVWSYNIASNQLRIVYNAGTHPNPILSGVDNIVGDHRGVLYVAEDGGDMQLVALFPDGRLKAIAQIIDNWGSEITGPAFDPTGTRLYFSSQRNPGTTYELSGPFSTIV